MFHVLRDVVVVVADSGTWCVTVVCCTPPPRQPCRGESWLAILPLVTSLMCKFRYLICKRRMDISNQEKNKSLIYYDN